MIPHPRPLHLMHYFSNFLLNHDLKYFIIRPVIDGEATASHSHIHAHIHTPTAESAMQGDDQLVGSS